MVAGHKGHPEVVAQQGRAGRRRRLKGARGRGTLDAEQPPVFGMLQGGGEVVLHILANVQQTTIQPIRKATIQAGSLVFTDEYDLDARLKRGATFTKRSIIARANTPQMTMATAFAKYMSILWKASGRFCGRGCVLIAAFLKNSSHCIWPSLSSSIPYDGAVKRSWGRYCSLC